ncbi:hypothetical protein [Haloplanus salinus]|jgi:hypothetical protein|uniref:hypothetical protein n=1 Tax=Haloplanus salinus TaxID=1126245 RepID=UPI001C698915|nr:hypothetical protein [Haloplanus salinus]
MAEAESGETDAVTAAGNGSESGGVAPSARALGYLRGATYALGTLLVLALLTVGTVGIIAEIKGTWHWAIHLESTVSYLGVFVAGVLALLLPAATLLVIARRVVDE